MFDVKLNRNPLNNFRPHILLPLNILLFLLPLPILLSFLLLLLPLNLHNLALHNLVEIDKQLPLKSFDKHHQSIANFNFGNIGREINIPVTLQQNHSNFILGPFISRKQLWIHIDTLIIILIQQLYLLHELRIIRKRRTTARIKFIQNKTVILIQTSIIHLYLLPQLL